MIVALMSSYREGTLGLAAARSVLSACDALIVYEGAVGGTGGEGGVALAGQIKSEAAAADVGFWLEGGRWESDAAKRTAMLEFAQEVCGGPDPLWCFWIDGDEILLYGEYLRDYIGKAEEQTGAGGFPIRIVEFDGSVALAHGRVFNAGLVAGFEEGSYQVRLKGGMVVALPNEPICVSGGVPVGRADGEAVTVEDLARLRPPLAGEPHFLHRWPLRSSDRQVRRLNADEPGWYDHAASSGSGRMLTDPMEEEDL